MPLFNPASSAADHIADTSDAHDASAISVADSAGDFTATDVEGVLAELGGAWTSFTPTLTAATTNPSGLSQVAGRYKKAGRLVLVVVEILYGGSPTVGSGEIRMALPSVTPESSWDAQFLAGGMWYDSSAPQVFSMYPRIDIANSRCVWWREGSGTALNATSFAANDQVHFNYYYEAA